MSAAPPAPKPPPGRALTESEGGAPILYGVLGAIFHLESLLPEDAARIERANAMVFDWFGSELAWTLNSRVGFTERFRPIDLAYAAAFPGDLVAPLEHVADPRAFEVAILAAATARSPFGLDCRGGADDRHASPYSYRFYAEINGAYSGFPQLTTSAALRVSVPTSWPLDDFRARVMALAETLRLRHGAAGLMYSGWEVTWYHHVDRAIYAHARRFPGFDTGFYVALMNEFHARIRSVNWLTFVGPLLLAELVKGSSARPTSDALVEVTEVGPNLMLQAGPRPEAGDVNRLSYPPAYVRADEMVRAVRAGGGVSFFDAWTEATTERWLRRFEKRLG